MDDSELFDENGAVVETEDGFREAPPKDDSAIDSEVDFDDEEYTEPEILIDEAEAGNAEGGQDAHLDDPAKVAEEDYP